MNVVVRIFLVVGALVVFLAIIRKIRRSEIQTTDSLFWLFFAGCLVVVALFPQIAFFFSNLIGFISPSNFVFVCVVGILVMRVFTLTTKLAHLRIKVTTLTQELALREHQHEQDKQ